MSSCVDVAMKSKTQKKTSVVMIYDYDSVGLMMIFVVYVYLSLLENFVFMVFMSFLLIFGDLI
jgi:hypothetical protein